MDLQAFPIKIDPQPIPYTTHGIFKQKKMTNFDIVRAERRVCHRTTIEREQPKKAREKKHTNNNEHEQRNTKIENQNKIKPHAYLYPKMSHTING